MVSPAWIPNVALIQTSLPEAVSTRRELLTAPIELLAQQRIATVERINIQIGY